MALENKAVRYRPRVIAGDAGTVNSIDLSGSPIPVRYKRGPNHLSLFEYPYEEASPDVLFYPNLKPGEYLSMWSRLPFMAVLDVSADHVSDVRAAQAAPGGVVEPDPLYDAATYTETFVGGANPILYSAIGRVDGLGYVATKTEGVTNLQNIGALPIPADLTILTYS